MLFEVLGRRAAKVACGLVAAGALVAGLATLGAGSGAAATSAHRQANPLPSSTQGLDVLPVPGTPAAPPATPVDFPAISPAQIGSVKVVGSRTGLHAGRLSAQPGHRGSQFAPTRPFAPGERVSVTATLRSAGAGTASGAPGARTLRFSFEVARPATVAARSTPLSSASAGSVASPDNLGVTPASAGLKGASQSTTHSFVTRPHLHPPLVDMVGKDTDHTSGDIFLTAQNSGQNGPYYLSSNGSLRWDHPTSGSGGKGPSAFNFRVQTYENHPYLTYWEGHLNFPPGDGTGVGVMLGEHYRRVHTVTAGAGYEHNGVDLHEFSVARDGTAFVTVYAPVHTNLRSVGGPSNGVVFDCIAQEINIATNRVVWEWDALRHVPLNASYAHYRSGQPFDFFHMNSIQDLGDGHVIISARHTWAVYSIDKSTGKISWVLGGRHPTFWMGSGTHFYWQHDAQLHNNGLLTVFDDGSGDGVKNESQSRALAIHLDTRTWHASLVHAYLHSPPVSADSMGSTELMSNHKVFVGWGAAPSFSEFTSGGSQIFKAWFTSPVDSYRGYRFNSFMGEPLGPPAIAARRSPAAGEDNVYVSWNGSTLVNKWRLRAGAKKSSLHAVKTVPWAAFETTIRTASAHYYQVQALTSKGRALKHGTSGVIAGA